MILFHKLQIIMHISIITSYLIIVAYSEKFSTRIPDKIFQWFIFSKLITIFKFCSSEIASRIFSYRKKWNYSCIKLTNHWNKFFEQISAKQYPSKQIPTSDLRICREEQRVLKPIAKNDEFSKLSERATSSLNDRNSKAPQARKAVAPDNKHTELRRWLTATNFSKAVRNSHGA